MKSFLLYTLEYPPQYGGIADYYYNLVNHWPKDNIAYYHLKNVDTSFYHLPKLAFDLKKKLNISTHLLVGHILPLGSVAYLLSFFKKFDYSIILHGLDFSLATKNKKKKLLAYLILKKAKYIVCANSYLGSQVKKKFPRFEKKIILSHPGAKVEKVDLGIRDSLVDKYNLKNKKIIFSLGRLVKRKGFDLCLNAIRQMKEFNPEIFQDLVYILAGSGQDKERLELLAKSYNILDKVIFLENISHQEKYALYSLCDMFIMTPREIEGDYEGFGIVYLEANLFAKPVIASGSGGVPDAVVNNINGLTIRPNDSLALVSAIIKLFTNVNLAQVLGKKGQQRAKQFFNWSYLTDNLAKKL